MCFKNKDAPVHTMQAYSRSSCIAASSSSPSPFSSSSNSFLSPLSLLLLLLILFPLPIFSSFSYYSSSSPLGAKTL
jgi:hypothetical protein